jgi:CRISPR-associated endonuclease Cas1
VARGAYDPERVQVCVQGLILREHGYTCDSGVLYFAESKERVKVAFDEELITLTQDAVDGLRLIAVGGHIPTPLEDSPKCPRCSLVGICLPDEVNFLKHGETPPRPLAVVNDHALPLYVQARGAKVSKNGETLEIWVDDAKAATARLNEVSQVVLQGNIYLTSPALQELMSREIPVTWASHGGWFYGHTIGTGHKNVELRTAQYRASFDDRVCRELARGLVAAKIRNQRTLLRRNWKDGELPENLLAEFRGDIEHAERAADLPQLLGVEGNGAARYFRHFAHMIRQPEADGDGSPSADWAFAFEKRNRRPPTDPVNALLSYAYSLLVRQFTVALTAVGFDPYRGYYHQPRYGRPALALDMMEPFRPLIADSVVIQVINNGEIHAEDFIRAAGSVNLTAEGRKRFLTAFERRLTHEVTHPIFGYSLEYRSLIELQSRLLGRFLLGEIDAYPNFTTR